MSTTVLGGIEKSIQDLEYEVGWTACPPGMGPLLALRVAGRWRETENNPEFSIGIPYVSK